MPTERKLMKMAVDEAIQCPSVPSLGNPKVGAVVLTKAGNVYRSHRGEFEGHPDDHAEFNVLTKKVPKEELEGCTVFTTLEPCTDRGANKLPCFEHILNAKAERVFIGLSDPNPVVLGVGRLRLEDAGIEVRAFDPDLRDKLDRINRSFVFRHKRNLKDRERNKRTTDPMRFKALNRPLLEELGRIRHADVNETPNFPLISKEAWMPDRLIPMHEVDKRSAGFAVRQDELPPVMPVVCGFNGLYSDWVKTNNPNTRLTPNSAFRMMGIKVLDGVPAFELSACNYLDFFNSIEAAMFELSADVAPKLDQARKKESAKGRRVQTEDIVQQVSGDLNLPLRSSFGDITTDFEKRCATIGVNCLLLVKNSPSGHHEIFLHDRTPLPNAQDTAAEAQNVFHVVPAGTFQSDEPEELNPRSIARTAMREYAEELVSEERVEQEVASGRDFMELPELKKLAASFEDGSTTLWHMGFGLDPATTKPELLCLMILDAKAVGITSYDEFFKENWEGKYFPVMWNKKAIKAWAAEERMLPAGAACLELAHTKFEEINAMLES